MGQPSQDPNSPAGTAGGIKQQPSVLKDFSFSLSASFCPSALSEKPDTDCWDTGITRSPQDLLHFNLHNFADVIPHRIQQHSLLLTKDDFKHFKGIVYPPKNILYYNLLLHFKPYDFFLLWNSLKIFWRMLVTNQLTVPTEFHNIFFSIVWKSMATSNSNTFFKVSSFVFRRKKERLIQVWNSLRVSKWWQFSFLGGLSL